MVDPAVDYARCLTQFLFEAKAYDWNFNFILFPKLLYHAWDVVRVVRRRYAEDSIEVEANNLSNCQESKTRSACVLLKVKFNVDQANEVLHLHSKDLR